MLRTDKENESRLLKTMNDHLPDELSRECLGSPFAIGMNLIFNEFKVELSTSVIYGKKIQTKIQSTG